MSQESVKSVVSNLSSGYGSFVGSNYDNFSNEGSQLYGPVLIICWNRLRSQNMIMRMLLWEQNHYNKYW